MLTANKAAARAALAAYLAGDLGAADMPAHSPAVARMERALNAALPLIEDAGEPLGEIRQTRPAGGEHKMLSDQLAGLADTVIRSEGRLADRIADLARLVVEQGPTATVELDTALTEPTEADLWARALGMAATHADPDDWNPGSLRSRARWFLGELLSGPGPLLDPDPDVEDVSVSGRPHLYHGVQRQYGHGETDPCWVRGCGLPPDADVHQLPGTGPNPISAPAG